MSRRGWRKILSANRWGFLRSLARDSVINVLAWLQLEGMGATLLLVVVWSSTFMILIVNGQMLDVVLFAMVIFYCRISLDQVQSATAALWFCFDGGCSSARASASSFTTSDRVVFMQHKILTSWFCLELFGFSFLDLIFSWTKITDLNNYLLSSR